MILRSLDESTYIFGKARPTEARAGMQEFGSNTIVESDAARNLLHVRTHLLAEICDLVDEGDLCRKKSIGRVLDQFGRSARGVKDGSLIEAKRPIDFRHNLPCALITRPNDNAIGVL